MRVVLAVDGSIAADRARDFVARLALPADTLVRAVAVMDGGPALSGTAWSDDASESKHGTESHRQHLLQALDTTRETLEAAGISHVDSVLLLGVPAHAIIDEADDYHADLLVVGHRGRGALATTLLGSTSTALVEHAHCPVLVVREPKVGRVLLADDGSASSREAVEAVARWPIFDHLPVTVVSVADVRIPIAIEVQPGIYEQVVESYIESADVAREQTAAIASRTADKLAAAGRQARSEMHEGAPASAIVETATALGVDLIVMGTRGHTGLARLALGGTARSVVIHAPCSVLVVRGLRAADDVVPVEAPSADHSVPLAATRS